MNIRQPVQNSMKPGRWVKTSCKMCLFTCNVRVLVSDAGVVLKIEGNPDSAANGAGSVPKETPVSCGITTPTGSSLRCSRTNPEKGPGVDPKWEPDRLGRGFRYRRPRVEKDTARGSAQAAARLRQFP